MLWRAAGEPLVTEGVAEPLTPEQLLADALR